MQSDQDDNDPSKKTTLPSLPLLEVNETTLPGIEALTSLIGAQALRTQPSEMVSTPSLPEVPPFLPPLHTLMAPMSMYWSNTQNLASTPITQPYAPPAPVLPPHFARFVLLEQPNEKQRKSYSTENRCLVPNPLVIAFRPDEDRTKIRGGTVTLSLGDKDGNELTQNQGVLDTLDKVFTKELDPQLCASFSVKILDTCNGKELRLIFVVHYEYEGEAVTETIISRSFVVSANRKKQRVDRQKPVLVDLKPKMGRPNGNTEVWIKGYNFMNRVGVVFDGHKADVLEFQENLVTVVAPQREDLQSTTTVAVSVFNKYGAEKLEAEDQLAFHYVVSGGTSSLREESMEQQQ